MSRTPVGGLIAAIILVFTAIAYYVTTATLEQQIDSDVRLRVERAKRQLEQSALLEGLSILKQSEVLATDGDFAIALEGDEARRRALTEEAFARFVESRGHNEAKPNLMWLLEKTGKVVAQYEISNPTESAFKDKDGKITYRAIELALQDGVIISDVWNHELGLLRVGVAPVIDPETRNPAGAVTIAYPLTAGQADRQQEILGAQVGYFQKDRIVATSFKSDSGENGARIQDKLSSILAIDDMGAIALSQRSAKSAVSASVDGKEYLASAVRLPRFTTSDRWPDDYPPYSAGAVVMMSLSEAKASLGTVAWALGLLGAGAFLLAILAMSVAKKRILHQADEIEDGINDIIDGNLERSIRPVGADLDGLAHAVNVMLARLLGRPEPGDEGYDDQGNLVSASRVDFDDNEELANLSPADDRSMKLAQETEPEYYSRVFQEYVDARQRAGESTDSITYENFVAKLRLNEAKLKVKYQCSAVRFRVDVKDGKVSLKPVPIV